MTEPGLVALGGPAIDDEEYAVLAALIAQDSELAVLHTDSEVLTALVVPTVWPAVWWAGLVTQAIKVAGATLKRLRSGRGHGLHATLVEEALRVFGVGDLCAATWTIMKNEAADAAQEEGPYGQLLTRLNDGAARPLLVGHSAGSEHVIELIELAARMELNITFDVALIAPASTHDRVARMLNRHAERLGEVRLLGLDDALEQRDTLLHAPDVPEPIRAALGWLYPHSVLYFVSGVCEAEADTPLVGLRRHHLPHPASHPLVQGYFAQSTGRTVWHNGGDWTHGSLDSDHNWLIAQVQVPNPAVLPTNGEQMDLAQVQVQNPAVLTPDGEQMDRAQLDDGMVAAKKRYVAVNRDFALMGGLPGPGFTDLVAQTSRENRLMHVGQQAALLSLTEAEASELRTQFSSVDLEEDIPHFLSRSPLVPKFKVQNVPYGQALNAVMLTVTDNQSIAIAGVKVVAFTPGGTAFTSLTDAQGVATFNVPVGTTLGPVYILPRSGFYAQKLPALPVAVQLQPLNLPGGSGRDWSTDWIRSGVNLCDGSGVKVAVVDTGVSHNALNVTQARWFLNGKSDSESSALDVDGHGTHVAGVIAAMNQVLGHAPQAELYAARVFDALPGGQAGGASSYDIARAIRWAVSQGCDVINLSLGSSQSSNVIQEACVEAAAMGTLVVAASGNDGLPVVNYPAKLPETVAVGALGVRGTYPASSLHAGAEPPVVQAHGVYRASFSNYGPEVRYLAPGVAVLSCMAAPLGTNPPLGQGVAAMDGTSMAAPQISGLAAALICQGNQPRSAARLRALLVQLDQIMSAVLKPYPGVTGPALPVPVPAANVVKAHSTRPMKANPPRKDGKS
ncbi:hypothetical protein BXU09_18650 [Deinococcus sp. LM3]|nr:hypothetical protein BXU09_18650 [Deinococcus sp. LM3]